MLGDDAPLLMLLRSGVVEWPLRLRLALFSPQRLGRGSAAELVKRMLRPESKEAFRELAEQYHSAPGELKLFTVSSGTPPATLNLVLARMLDARPIVNMTPSLLPRRLFALNIIPVHDDKRPARAAAQSAAKHGNVVTTPLALGYFDAPAAHLLARTICQEHALDPQGRYLGLAIGGPSKSAPWDRELVLRALELVLAIARQQASRLLVTTSRRTPQWCREWLQRNYIGQPEVPYFLDAAADPLNPLPAFYDLARAMLITEDSFSMICEAVHAGHQPLLLPVSGGKRAGKLSRALASLVTRGLAQRLDVRRSGSALINLPAARTLPANALYDELRTEVRTRLGLR